MLRNFQFNRSQRGFSLLEMMIVLVIVGILAALAIPRLRPAATKSRQAEAKLILKHVYTMQDAYHTENLRYGCNGRRASATTPNAFQDIGVELMQTALYTYRMSASRTRFTCTATANIDDDRTIDRWRINQTGVLRCLSNDAES